MLGDHDVNAVTTAGELVGQDLATEDASAAAIEAWLDTGTAGGNAGRDRVGAAGARVFDAPLNADRRRWAGSANRSWLTACVLTANRSPVVE